MSTAGLQLAGFTVQCFENCCDVLGVKREGCFCGEAADSDRTDAVIGGFVQCWEANQAAFREIKGNRDLCAGISASLNVESIL